MDQELLADIWLEQAYEAERLLRDMGLNPDDFHDEIWGAPRL